jgi:hypothetical protein
MRVATAADSPQRLEGTAALASAMTEAVTAARTEILLLSHSLDRRLYGAESFVGAVKDFCLRSERARLCILLNQPRSAVDQAPGLIELGRRLSSRVEFRDLAAEKLEDFRGEWLIVDGRSVLERRTPEALVATLWRESPLPAREKRDAFLSLWEQAQASQELRALGI